MSVLTNLCFGDGYSMEFGKVHWFCLLGSMPWRMLMETQAKLGHTSLMDNLYI